MKFMPDSAILGTAGRVKHWAKKKPRSTASVSRVTRREVSWVSYQMDTRSLDQLLVLARRHAEESAKQEMSGK